MRRSVSITWCLWCLWCAVIQCEPNYNPKKVKDGRDFPLDKVLPGIVVLHATGWASTKPRGNNWLRDTIFPTNYYTHISINDYQIMDYLEKNQTAPNVFPSVLVYNVENSGPDAGYALPRRLIALYGIKVVFNPSDEWKGWGKKYFYGEGTEVYPLVDVVLREYSVIPYRDDNHPHRNVFQMPMMYADGYLHEPRNNSYPLSWVPSINITVSATQYRENYHENGSYYSGLEIMRRAMTVKAESRHYLWAFVGSLQGYNKGYEERRQVVFTYRDIYVPNFISTVFPPSSLFEVYLNSRFVMVMKGQYNLECSRSTEGSFAGAIPVVVADSYEMGREYYFEEDRPPYLYETSYERAFERMVTMSNETIDEMRLNITRWQERRWHEMHNMTLACARRQHQRHFGHTRYLHKLHHHGAAATTTADHHR